MVIKIVKMPRKINDDTEEEIAKVVGTIYGIWCVVVSVIDIIVCAHIFYRVEVERTIQETGRKYDYYYIQQLYSLPGMENNLSHWLEVYGATSVTKLASYLPLFINPFLILIINSYLYATSIDINNTLGPQCNNQINQTITCQVFDDQYQQLIELNKIQLFGSIVLVCLIPAVAIIVFGFAALMLIPNYVYEVTVKFHKTVCCKCYRRFCQNVFYIFCYGPEPEKLIKVEKLVRAETERAETKSV